MTDDQAIEDVRATLIRWAEAGAHNTSLSAPSSLLHWLHDYRDAYPRQADRLATGRVIAARLGVEWREDRMLWTDQAIGAMVECLLRVGGPALHAPAHESFRMLAQDLRYGSDPGIEQIVVEIAKHLGPIPRHDAGA